MSPEPITIEVHRAFRKAPVRPKKAPRTRVKVKVRKVPAKKKKAWKFKRTELTKLDSDFSGKIRRRDGKCLFPGCHITDFAKLQCSHYHGRANWNTRFDEQNCIALCARHHFWDKMLGWEYQKQTKDQHGWDGQYTLFMYNLLGALKFEQLLDRSKEKKSRKEAMQEYRTLMEEHVDKPESLA